MKGTQQDFEKITRFVEGNLDFSTSYYQEKYLKRRIRSRIRRTKSKDYAEYLDVLRSDEDEQTALLDAFSVNVTRFFRNPEIWGEIRHLLRELTRERDTVKVWSAACSDGREAYSLAMMAIDDPEVDESRIRITATDIDPDILREARRGVYQQTQTVDLNEQLGTVLKTWRPYVDQDDDQYAVKPGVKQMVRFERHDLIRGKPKRGYDLVLCRNLMIYIDKEFKIPILTTLRNSLSVGGYLIIGKTENLPLEMKRKFEPVNNKLRVYRKKGTEE